MTFHVFGIFWTSVYNQVFKPLVTVCSNKLKYGNCKSQLQFFFLELNVQKHEFYARGNWHFGENCSRKEKRKSIMLTDSAQTVIVLMFSVLVITDIVGNTLVCIVMIKNQDMRWVSMGKFELLFSPSNSEQFSFKCVSLDQSNFLETKLCFITRGRSSYRCFRWLKQWTRKKKTIQTTSICVLLVTYKYIYSRVDHKSRLLSLFVSSIYCYQVWK